MTMTFTEISGSGSAAMGLVRYGTTTDPDSYAGDFPTWEPRPDALITPDGVRIHTHKVLRRSDTGEVLGVVGDGYVARSHAQLAADLDAIARPFGGRRTLGPAKVITKGARVTALVALPRECRSLLSVGTDERGASLMLRDARDGTLRESASLAVIRFACSNGLVRVGASKLVASAKHTAAIAWLPETLSRWSHEVVEDLRHTGERIRALSERRVSLDDVTTFAQRVANPEKADKGQAKVREDKIVDLVLSADGTWVPRFDGGMRAVQLLEAATAYDRHVAGTGRAKDAQDIAWRRIERLADGEGLGARAWSVLEAMYAA